MLQKYRASVQVIENLANHITPDVLQAIEAHCSAELAANLERSLANALQHCETAKNLEGALVFEGYAEIDGKRIDVCFPTPADATQAEKDSAFLVYLAEKMALGYQLTATTSGL